MKAIFISIITLLFLCSPAFAQSTERNSNISIDPSLSLNEALQVMEYFSQRDMGKRLLNMSSSNPTIGIPINNMPWQTALDLILLKHNLLVEDHPGYLAVITPIPPEEQEVIVPEGEKIGKNKQVRIKSVALVADRAYMRSLGIDWSTLLDGKVLVNLDFKGASNIPGDLFGVSGSGAGTVGNTQVEVNTLLKAIESNQMGTIIAQPVVVVSSGSKGYIQVGQDISVKTVDEAGNTTDTFFATGVIMDVTPTIVTVDGQELIHLALSIERSSGSPGTVSTVINRSKSTTELVLYDGEETVIAGLYDTDEIRNRGGIPILKDLPWWVFGIRYLTGYYSYEKKERELLILIKAEIVDSALDRYNRALQEAQRVPQ